MRKIKRYGWRRDIPDVRDFRLDLARIDLAQLPKAVDLRAHLPPVYDQGALGSCTANAIAAALDYANAHQGQPIITPSRLFIYWNERAIEGTVLSDDGAQIRDGMKVVARLGACPERLWPYDEGKFSARPTPDCFLAAKLEQVVHYRRVRQDIAHVKATLAQGLPVVFGFTVYDSFESQTVADTGIMPMPNTDLESIIGGHAVLACGYDDALNAWLVRNSWGTGWGQNGYFWMPYNYTDHSLSSDYWVLERVL